MTVLSIGEILWDIFPDGAHLGGAPFNFAASCARLGDRALFLSAVGEDALGTRALKGIAAAAVSTEFVQRTNRSPTGTVQVTFDREGQPEYTIERPAAYDFIDAGEETVACLAAQRPSLIYFGSLSQTYASNREAVAAVIAAIPEALKFYDVNLRKDGFSRELLQELMCVADLAKFNEAETETVQALFGTDEKSLEGFCRVYAERYEWRGVCVTRGPEGCVILLDGVYVEVSGFPVEKAHPVGAGDAFSAAFCHGISQGWPAQRIGDFANRVGALVASRPGAVSQWTVEDCYLLTRPEEVSIEGPER